MKTKNTKLEQTRARSNTPKNPTSREFSGELSNSPENNPHPLHSQTENGGQTTISPPANVNPLNSPNTSILISGIDTIELSMDIEWRNRNFFEYLESVKEVAVDEKVQKTIGMVGKENKEEWLCDLQPYGQKGYEWVLNGKEYYLRIGNWDLPQFRPGALIKIYSETLWKMGAESAVARILDLLDGMGGEVQIAKISRADLCVDVLVDEIFWSDKLFKCRVTRALNANPYYYGDRLTGMQIGKGNIMGRLYDKPLEIQKKGKKGWMFDIWGIDDVPESKKIIRVEAQFRRQVLKELKIDSVWGLFEKQAGLWTYFSKNWLKFQNNPGTHHTQRETLPFWKTVQSGFNGSQDANPLIRYKACREDEKQLLAQVYGLVTSIIAIRMGLKTPNSINGISIKEGFGVVKKNLWRVNKDDETFETDVFEKVAKHQRSDCLNQEIAEEGQE